MGLLTISPPGEMKDQKPNMTAPSQLSVIMSSCPQTMCLPPYRFRDQVKQYAKNRLMDYREQRQRIFS